MSDVCHSCSTEDVLLAATRINLGDQQPVNENQNNDRELRTGVGSLGFARFAAKRSSITSLRLLIFRKLDSQSCAQRPKALQPEIAFCNPSVNSREIQLITICRSRDKSKGNSKLR
jgi:hypothetical protein